MNGAPFAVFSTRESKNGRKTGQFSVAFINSLNWSLGLLREDLKASFADQAAAMLGQIHRAYGDGGVEDRFVKKVRYPGFYEIFRAKLEA